MTKKAVVETEVAVPFSDFGLRIQGRDGQLWLSDWLDEHFSGRVVGDVITYGKMRITVGVM